MDANWVNAVANLGGVGILGYWLIVSLPAMLRQFDCTHTEMIKGILADQIAERKMFGERTGKLASSIDRMAIAIHDFIRRSDDRRIT